MSMNPRETTEKIRDDYLEYLASILNVRDHELTRLARQKIQKTRFVQGPFLETTLPFVNGKKLSELADEGLVSNEFSVMGQDCHYDEWALRIHQENALRHIIQDDRNMVVSTGTGSGKTECYLYPIFNALMREKEAGTLGPGVRALLIFPMNALANDQQKKLRKLLRNYPDITFGRYTGETPHITSKETVDAGEERLHKEYDQEHADEVDPALRHAVNNEFISREKMIETPPHILLTNYAMLEYLLLRPDTTSFFDGDTAKHWKFIVIDEAHTYKGASGTEIAFLLRRVKERIRHNGDINFRCIATSATLGSDPDGAASLAAFASRLFGEPFEARDVITTQRQKRTPPEDARKFVPEDYVSLKEQADALPEEEKGKLLHSSLIRDLRLFDLYRTLSEKPKKIEDVAEAVFPDVSGQVEREAALIDLIELAAAAKRSNEDAALLPARYHLFVKSLEGMYAQYYPRKNVFLDRRERVQENGASYAVFELANCARCDQEYIVGTTVERETGSYLVQTSTEEKPEYYFISDSDKGDLEVFDEDDAIDEREHLSSLPRYHLCLCCGRITDYAEKKTAACCPDPDPKKVVSAYKLTYRGKSKESNCCLCCGSTRKGLISRFLTSNQPATFAVAKSLYDAIPPRPIRSAKAEAQDDPFDDDPFDFDDDDFSNAVSEELADESGRKLLIFSDNRQEAAFFAGFFEKRYMQLVWRKIIIRCLREAREHTLKMDDLIDQVCSEADDYGLFTVDREQQLPTDAQKKKIAAWYVMQEFLSPDRITGPEGMAQIEFFPEPLKPKGVTLAGLSDSTEVWLLLRALMDSLRQKGAVSYPKNIRATDEFFEPRNHYCYFREAGSKNTFDGKVIGFIPADSAINRRLSLMLKLVPEEITDPAARREKALSYLKDAYELLLKTEKGGYLIRTAVNRNTETVYCLNYAKWSARYIDDADTVYQCSKCNRIHSYAVRDVCPEPKCAGKLKPVPAAEARALPYYTKQYSERKLIPMVAREHTAQLSASTARTYQEDFEKGKINVLSCSTTFEMGVDVGELEATFLRNVPPETSNYIQRAGRAGRRTSSAAFCVTFARRTSHDMTFFQQPEKIIAGHISPPVLETTNDRIAERHLNSIVISWFFREHPEFFKGNAERIALKDELNDDMATTLRRCLEEHPVHLLKSIHDVLPQNVCDDLRVDEWAFVDDIVGEDGSLSMAIEECGADVGSLREFIDTVLNDAKDNGTSVGGRIGFAEKLIKTLNTEPSINFLSAHGVLPKYGFPIDSVSLDVIGGEKEESKKIDLSRDLKMAISEFSPPAEIIANGKVWKSYAINTVPNKSWPTYVYYECPECKRIYPPTKSVVPVNYDLAAETPARCRHCQTLLNARKFIIPKFGFSTSMEDKPKMVGESRPGTYYITRTQFWDVDDLTEKQRAEVTEEAVEVGGKTVRATYSPGGKLFVLNQGNGNAGITVCPSCGYAHDPLSTPMKKGQHKTKYGRPCSGRSFQSVSLGHVFSTDVLRIKLPEHMVRVDAEDAHGIIKDQHISVLYAILEGASTALDISREDISGCLTGDGEIVLFDDTPSGSGFVKQISMNLPKVLREARDRVSGGCGCTEETSCYGCLRNYSNQYFHDTLSRGLAKRYLDWLLEQQSPDAAAEEEKAEPEKTAPVNTGLRGKRLSRYVAPDTTAEPDSVAQLEELLEEVEEAASAQAIRSLITLLKDRQTENPLTMRSIELPSGSVWPSLFWGGAHIALFTPELRAQFQTLLDYDWYCFMLDDSFDSGQVLSLLTE